MKATPVRYCIECGKQHNTGIEDRMEGTFEPMDTCIDCLMEKCSFKPIQDQVTLEDTKNMTYDELHKKLGETMLEILSKTYWNPPNEVHNLPKS